MPMTKRRGLTAGLLFFFYMYAFMTTLTLADTRAVALLGDSAAVRAHYVDYLFLLAGLLLCAVCGHRLPARRKQLLLAVFTSVCTALLALLFLSGSQARFQIVAAMLSLTLGLAGSLVYFLMAVNLRGSNRTGLVMALSSSGAILLQQLTARTDVTFGALLLAGLACTVWTWLFFCRRGAGALEWELSGHIQKTDARWEQGRVKELAAVVIIILCLEFISGFNDGFNVRMFSKGSIDLYGWPRLLLVPAFLLAGFLADIKKRRYFAISVICMYMMSVFAPIFLIDKRFYLLNLCMFYPYMAFLVTYVNVTFWDMAAQSRRPELVAPLGRILDCTTSIVFSLWHITGNYYLCIAIQLILLILAWAAALWQNQQRAIAALPASAGLRTLDDFLNAYGLTEKERELAGVVLTRDVGIKEIAAMVYSSERGVYRYLNQIYEKTGTDSRTGLLIRYHEFIAGEKTPVATDIAAQ